MNMTATKIQRASASLTIYDHGPCSPGSDATVQLIVRVARRNRQLPTQDISYFMLILRIKAACSSCGLVDTAFAICGAMSLWHVKDGTMVYKIPMCG